MDTSLSDLKAVGINIDTIVYNSGNGDVIMANNSRKSGHIINSSFGNNVNIQGDNVIQTITNSAEFNTAYEALVADILKYNNEAQKEQNIYFAEQLKEAFQQKDKTNGERMLGFLRESLGGIGSIASIAGFFLAL